MKKILLTSFAITSYLASQAQCTELFISEYVEGSGNDKGIEIYNPTNETVSLEGYSVARYSNGATTTSIPIDLLSGSIAPFDAFVLVNGQVITETNSPACSPAMQALADQLAELYPGAMYMNGNDAVALFKDGIMIDLIGKIGENPGDSWVDINDAYWTKDHTLIRKPSVQSGVTVNPIFFDVVAEWDSLPENTWNNLGSHVCDCSSVGIKEISNNSVLRAYPNPVNKGELNLVSNKSIKSISFVNSLGQLAFSNNFNAGIKNLVISTKNLVFGVYQVIAINSDNTQSTIKISIE
jgi:predicted extracellular nuclease